MAKRSPVSASTWTSEFRGIGAGPVVWVGRHGRRVLVAEHHEANDRSDDAWSPSAAMPIRRPPLRLETAPWSSEPRSASAISPAVANRSAGLLAVALVTTSSKDRGGRLASSSVPGRLAPGARTSWPPRSPCGAAESRSGIRTARTPASRRRPARRPHPRSSSERVRADETMSPFSSNSRALARGRRARPAVRAAPPRRGRGTPSPGRTGSPSARRSRRPLDAFLGSAASPLRRDASEHAEPERPFDRVGARRGVLRRLGGLVDRPERDPGLREERVEVRPSVAVFEQGRDGLLGDRVRGATSPASISTSNRTSAERQYPISWPVSRRNVR